MIIITLYDTTWFSPNSFNNIKKVFQIIKLLDVIEYCNMQLAVSDQTDV